MSVATAVIVSFLAGLGLPGAVIVVLIANPEKSQLWYSMVLGVIRRVTKRAELAYVASDVSAQINLHLKKEVLPTLSGMTATRVAIRWNNSGTAVAREVAGTLIVRLKQHEDRFENILNAYLVAVPRMYAPAVRSQLSNTQSRAIDLQLCRKLAERMSASAVTVYRLNILDPSVHDDPALTPLLTELQATDLGGLFVPVLLQELIKLGAAYPADSLPQLDREVHRLVRFLKTVAERARGEIVELSFLGQYIRINTLLVAKKETRAKGLNPFRFRIGLELAKGVDTFYVMAADANIEFAQTVAAALDGDRRLLRREARKLFFYRDGQRTKGVIMPFERNLGYGADELLEEGVRSGQLAVGSEHLATVTDVQPSYVAVDVEGIQGVVPISHVSWEYLQDCNTSVHTGDEFRVRVLEARPDQQELVVSRRLCIPNPVATINPNLLMGTEQVLTVQARAGSDPGRRFVAGPLEAFPSVSARLYEGELEWGAPLHGVSDLRDGVRIRVMVYDLRVNQGYVLASRKRLVADQWSEIRAKYARGARLTVRVTAVRPEGAWCEVEPGLVGFVPASEFRTAGLEYANFEVNLRPGQDLFVYVGRVVAGERQRLTLGLQRNLR